MEYALKTRGIIYLNVETSLLFAPPIKILATCLTLSTYATLTWAHKCNQLFLILHKIHSQQIQYAQSKGNVLILHHQIGVRALLPDSLQLLHHMKVKITLSDKITPLWKRICKPPEIQMGCCWGDFRSTASLGLIMELMLVDCNRSSFVSLKFSFTVLSF